MRVVEPPLRALLSHFDDEDYVLVFKKNLNLTIAQYTLLPYVNICLIIQK